MCALKKTHSLYIWLPVSVETPLAFTLDAEPLPLPHATPVQGGLRFHIILKQPLPYPKTLEITEGKDRRQHHSLILAQKIYQPALIVARQYLREGRTPMAKRVVLDALPIIDDSEMRFALSLLGRIFLSAQKPAEAMNYWRSAMQLHDTAACASCAVRDGAALAYHYIFGERRYYVAATLLRTLRQYKTDGFPAAPLHLLYYGGLLARERGDRTAALSMLRESRNVAERLGNALLQRAAQQMLAVSLQDLGRSAEALQLMQQLLSSLPEDATSCARGDLNLHAGWVAAQAAEAAALPLQEELVRNASTLLHRAIAAYGDETDCQQPWKKSVAWTNLAFTQLVAQTPRAAQRSIRKATQSHHNDQRLSLWMLDLAGHAALQLHKPQEALSLFERIRHGPQQTLPAQVRWRADFGTGMAHMKRHEFQEAKFFFAAAERSIDEAVSSIAPREGRSTFLGLYSDNTRSYLRLLLSMGEVEKAYAVARNSRRRAYADLSFQSRLALLPKEARYRWDSAIAVYRAERSQLEKLRAQKWALATEELPRATENERLAQKRADEALNAAVNIVHAKDRAASAQAELRPTRKSTNTSGANDWGVNKNDKKGEASARGDNTHEGELVLLYFPLGSGWALFAHIQGSTRAQVRGPQPQGYAADQEWSDYLLAPFEPLIENAERIRLLVSGDLERIDIHALPWRGSPLMFSKPVAYGLDVPILKRRATAKPHPLRMLWVRDPTGNLNGARHVGNEWALNTQAVFSQLSGDDATLFALRQGLKQKDLLHYAGHGKFAGLEGWESTLPLAEGTSLGIADILTLPYIPQSIVLAGCSSGRVATTRGAALGHGLAQAFILRGASSVVASMRKLPDTLAKKFEASYYKKGNTIPLGPWRVAQATASASAALKRNDPQSDWSIFRVLIP